MRYLTTIKSSEQQGPPPPALMDAMGRLTEEGLRDGNLLESGGLAPTASGARIRVRDGRLHVTDGPFTEAREVVGGYAFIEARSREEAVAIATRVLQVHIDHWVGWEGEIEVRQVFGPDDGPPSAG